MMNYSIHYYYTLNELIKLNETHQLEKDKDGLFSLLFYALGYSNITDFSEVFDLHGIDYEDLLAYKGDPTLVINSTSYTKLINILVLRYGEHFIVDNPTEIEAIYDEDNPLLKEWCNKFLAVLFFTKDKYINILKAYDDSLSKLLDPVKIKSGEIRASTRHEDYDNEVTSKEIYNDTPQSTDVVATLEQDQYASSLSKGVAHTDNVGDTSENSSTEHASENDMETKMNRIAEIQDKFSKVLYNWSEEFKSLFIEPLNV